MDIGLILEIVLTAIEILVIILILDHRRCLNNHDKALGRHLARIDNHVVELENHAKRIEVCVDNRYDHLDEISKTRSSATSRTAATKNLSKLRWEKALKKK